MASRREKLIENARPYLDEGEEVRYIVSGQTGAPQGPLGSIAIVIGKAKQRRVVATDSHLYVLEGDFWGTAKSKGLVAKFPTRRGRCELRRPGPQGERGDDLDPPVRRGRRAEPRLAPGGLGGWRHERRGRRADREPGDGRAPPLARDRGRDAREADARRGLGPSRRRRLRRPPPPALGGALRGAEGTARPRGRRRAAGAAPGRARERAAGAPAPVAERWGGGAPRVRRGAGSARIRADARGRLRGGTRGADRRARPDGPARRRRVRARARREHCCRPRRRRGSWR